MITPTILCSHCGAKIAQGDKFCATCGSRIDLESGTHRDSMASSGKEVLLCALCGQQNSPGSVSCESCGGALGKRKQTGGKEGTNLHQAPKSPPRKTRATPGKIIRLLQSWKLTLGLALVFVVVLVVVGTSKNTPDHVHTNLGLTGKAAEAMVEIERLQKAVESNPDDMESTLRLANLFHDVKFFPRAVTMYQRYLQRHPTSPDARVDLGICYFELALTDSSRQWEYLAIAMQEMKKTLEYAPRHQLAYFNLGIVSLHAGDIEESNSWFKKCVDLDPVSGTGRRAQALYNQHQPGMLPRE